MIFTNSEKIKLIIFKRLQMQKVGEGKGKVRTVTVHCHTILSNQGPDFSQQNTLKL